MSNIKKLPFNIVDPITKASFVEEKADTISTRNINGQMVRIMDFKPAVLQSAGAYENNHSLDGLDIIKPTGNSYIPNYKTKSFGDLNQLCKSKKTILDLGCNCCEILREFPSHLIKVGVDISSICMFGSSPNALDSDVDHLWICDATNLPVPDSSIDLILSCDILEHMVSPENLLREIKRVLSPGGIVIITVPNLVSFGTRLSILFGYGSGLELAQILKLKSPFIAINGPRFPDQKKHLRWFTSSSLKSFVATEGFEILRQFGCGPITTRLKISNFMANISLLTGLIARKPSSACES